MTMAGWLFVWQGVCILLLGIGLSMLQKDLRTLAYKVKSLDAAVATLFALHGKQRDRIEALPKPLNLYQCYKCGKVGPESNWRPLGGSSYFCCGECRGNVFYVPTHQGVDP